MQHETATVKKAVKSYSLKNGDKKESISYTINLGVNSAFDDNDKVAIIPISDFNNLSDVDADVIADLENAVADKDATITANAKSIDELNAKVENNSVLINDLRDKLTASEKTINDLESDVSKKDKKISELESIIADKDNKISDLEKQTAIYNAIDIDDLQNKADELDKSKNVIIKLQNDINHLQNKQNEYLLLVNFKDKQIVKLENKGVFDTLFGKYVTADIVEPTLSLIDVSGNPIADKSNDETNANADSGDVANTGADSSKNKLT